MFILCTKLELIISSSYDWWGHASPSLHCATYISSQFISKISKKIFESIQIDYFVIQVMFSHFNELVVLANSCLCLNAMNNSHPQGHTVWQKHIKSINNVQPQLIRHQHSSKTLGIAGIISVSTFPLYHWCPIINTTEQRVVQPHGCFERGNPKRQFIVNRMNDIFR